MGNLCCFFSYMTSIANIVDAVRNPFCIWRTLRGIEPLCCDGKPRYVVGNAAVTFFVRHNGESKVLKCYTRTHKNLGIIYGSDFHSRELCIADLTGRKVWIDCLLTKFIEGTTLDNLLKEKLSADALHSIATAFDRMALQLLSSPRAHGDLKPENIVVAPDFQSMQAIDWDAAYLPQLSGEQANEIGTAAYQHPARTMEMYDKHIDDYSIAAISTLLHAASIEANVLEYYRNNFEPPFSPRLITRRQTKQIDPIIDAFARKGMAAQYHIVKMLTSPTPRLFQLQTILELTAELSHRPMENQQELQADEMNGLWGCRSSVGWVVAPLFDSAFDPSEGVMLVTLGAYKHFIDLDSRPLVTFSKETIVKPFRNGKTTISQPNGTNYTLELYQILHNSNK